MATPLSAATALAKLKAEGLAVQEYKDWRTHNRAGHGAWGGVNGVMIHHTVTSADDSSVALCYNGHSTLPGPLCHSVGRNDGKVAMVGWGRANHAGLGDDDVLAAVIAEKALPAVNEANTDGNARFYGLEIVNLGDNKDVYTAKQYEAAVKWATALCRAHGWSERSVIGHKEWQPGKIDPRGPVEGHGSFSMNTFRGHVKAALAQPAGKWTLAGKAPAPVPTTPAPVPTTPKAPAITPKSRESAATVKAQATAALKSWPFIPEVEKKHGLSANLLLAVGSRETNLRNISGDGGHGRGVWQRDDRWWPIPTDYATNVRQQAEDAATLLAANYKALGNWGAAAAAYNAGLTGVKNALAAGKSADSATTGGGYGADVLGRQKHLEDAAPKPVPAPAKPAAKPWIWFENAQPKKGPNNSVVIVQKALIKEFKTSNKPSSVWGPKTTALYRRWQQKLNYSGSDADGVPGESSMKALAKKHGFDIKHKAAKGTSSGRAASPVPGKKVTFAYGVKRASYAAGYHTGDDYAATTGTKVVAVRAGTIQWSNGSGGAYGNWIGLKADNGRVYVYCHLSSRSVSTGAKVKAGQQIGKVGATGNVTGPHLHFEDHPAGAFVYARGRKPKW